MCAMCSLAVAPLLNHSKGTQGTLQRRADSYDDHCATAAYRNKRRGVAGECINEALVQMCGRDEPDPGADVAAVSPVPMQMWQR